MWNRMIKRHASAGPGVPDGMGAFLAGVLLLAVPIVAMVASTTAPTERGHWVVLFFGLSLVAFGAFRGRGSLPG